MEFIRYSTLLAVSRSLKPRIQTYLSGKSHWGAPSTHFARANLTTTQFDRFHRAGAALLLGQFARPILAVAVETFDLVQLRARVSGHTILQIICDATDQSLHQLLGGNEFLKMDTAYPSISTHANVEAVWRIERSGKRCRFSEWTVKSDAMRVFSRGSPRKAA